MMTLKAAALEKLRPVEETLTEPEGPNPQASLRLADVFEDEALVNELSGICGWDHDLILQDRAAGHVFYYLPREFLLRRDESGYGLGVQYNSRAEPGQPSVTLNADLEAPRRAGDVTLLKAILRQAFGPAAGAPLEVRSLPGLGATVDLESLATGLALPPERVHVIPPAHLQKPLRLTLSLTQDEAEAVFSQIEHEGLAGFVSVPVGDQTVRIDLRIQYRRFAGTEVGGFDRWLAGEPLDESRKPHGFPAPRGERSRPAHVRRAARAGEQATQDQLAHPAA